MEGMESMNTEYVDGDGADRGGADRGEADPRELAALREAFAPERCLPPLGWEAVRAFEREHGIVLPEPYRTLVAEICDGCTEGPADVDGLIPVAALPADWGCDQTERVLSKPFPLTGAWTWEDDARPYEVIEPLIDEVSNHGSVVLGTDGCGMYWHLVVTGEQRGRIWNISDVGAAPFGATFGHFSAGDGFVGWVADWAATRRPWFEVVV
jgi:hypothetical protein